MWFMLYVLHKRESNFAVSVAKSSFTVILWGMPTFSSCRNCGIFYLRDGEVDSPEKVFSSFLELGWITCYFDLHSSNCCVIPQGKIYHWVCKEDTEKFSIGAIFCVMVTDELRRMEKERWVSVAEVKPQQSAWTTWWPMEPTRNSTLLRSVWPLSIPYQA